MLPSRRDYRPGSLSFAATPRSQLLFSGSRLLAPSSSGGVLCSSRNRLCALRHSLRNLLVTTGITLTHPNPSLGHDVRVPGEIEQVARRHQQRRGLVGRNGVRRRENVIIA